MMFKGKKRNVVRVPLATLAIIWRDNPQKDTDHTLVVEEDKRPEPKAFERPELNNEILSFFWKHYVEPLMHDNLQNGNNLIKALTMVCKKLDEKGSTTNAPSGGQNDDDHLRKAATIIEHSVEVAKKMYEKIAHREDAEAWNLAAILTGLSHDIGKLYAKNKKIPHEERSYKFIKAFLGSDGLSQQILEAVKNHHLQGELPDQVLLQTLIYEDRQVRENEELKVMGTGIVAEPRKVEPKFTAQQLAKKIEAKLASVGFDVFAFEGKIYIDPKALREIICELEGDTKAIDQINIIKEWLKNLVKDGIGFINGQFRLKYTKREIKPEKKYYFVLDGKAAGINTDTVGVPRDESGKWLRQIDTLKVLKD